MMTFMALLALAAPPDRSYEPQVRQTYIAEGIAALRETSVDTLLNARAYLHTMNLDWCTSEHQRLRIDCLVEKTRTNCRTHKTLRDRRACVRYSDVIVVNILSEDVFIDEATRFTLMQESADYHAAVRRELGLRYAELAVGFRLGGNYRCHDGDLACLAPAIDAHCLQVASHSNMSWQHCTAALIWAVGAAGRDEQNP